MQETGGRMWKTGNWMRTGHCWRWRTNGQTRKVQRKTEPARAPGGIFTLTTWCGLAGTTLLAAGRHNAASLAITSKLTTWGCELLTFNLELSTYTERNRQ